MASGAIIRSLKEQNIFAFKFYPQIEKKILEHVYKIKCSGEQAVRNLHTRCTFNVVLKAPFRLDCLYWVLILRSIPTRY